MLPDEEFEKIKDDALSKMAAVKCGIPEYIAAMKDLIANIEISIESAEGDLARLDEEAMAMDEDDEHAGDEY